MAERIPSYPALLGDVLRRRDPEALRSFLVESARRYGDERQVADVESKTSDEMQELLHRMIVARVDLQGIHHESREWLDRRGIAADSGD